MAKYTPEERTEIYRQTIRKTKPWEKTTGPKTPEGKAVVSLNKLGHGIRSRDPKRRSIALFVRAFLDDCRKTPEKTRNCLKAIHDNLDNPSAETKQKLSKAITDLVETLDESDSTGTVTPKKNHEQKANQSRHLPAATVGKEPAFVRRGQKGKAKPTDRGELLPTSEQAVRTPRRRGRPKKGDAGTANSNG